MTYYSLRGARTSSRRLFANRGYCYWRAIDLASGERRLTENSTNRADTFRASRARGGEPSGANERRPGAICEYAGRESCAGKNFSEPCHGCGTGPLRPCAGYRSGPLVRLRFRAIAARTNKRAGVFCFAKRLVKRAPRRNRWQDGVRKKANDRIDFIIFHGGKNSLTLLPPPRSALK